MLSSSSSSSSLWVHFSCGFSTQVNPFTLHNPLVIWKHIPLDSTMEVEMLGLPIQEFHSYRLFNFFLHLIKLSWTLSVLTNHETWESFRPLKPFCRLSNVDTWTLTSWTASSASSLVPEYGFKWDSHNTSTPRPCLLQTTLAHWNRFKLQWNLFDLCVFLLLLTSPRLSVS